VKDGEKMKYHETSGKNNKKVSSGPEIYHLTSKNDIGFDRLAGVAGLVRQRFVWISPQQDLAQNPCHDHGHHHHQ
jgi:hypothetical protein